MKDQVQKPYPGWIVPPGKLDPAIQAIIEAQFDAETDVDVQKIALAKKADVYARKLSILRTLSFPIEFIAGTLIFGFKFAKRRLALQKDLTRFIFKCITYKEVVRSIEKNA